MTTNLSTPKRALAIGAHADDVEFGCGGTFAKWAAAGCEIFHLICTDGSKGTRDPARDPAELVATRQSEQRAAARALGGTTEVVFLGLLDGELEVGRARQREIVRWIRTIAPDVVLGHDPWKRYRLHPDHRNAGFLLTDGVVAARDPLFFPDLGLAAHRPRNVLLWEADTIDHVEDISRSVETKIAALLKHRSQLHSTMAIPDEQADGGPALDSFRARILARATQVGVPYGFAAGEGFKLLEA
jgi:LmbE family N-acetylglucosaminyl deacetylase